MIIRELPIINGKWHNTFYKITGYKVWTTNYQPVKSRYRPLTRSFFADPNTKGFGYLAGHQEKSQILLPSWRIKPRFFGSQCSMARIRLYNLEQFELLEPISSRDATFGTGIRKYINTRALAWLLVIVLWCQKQPIYKRVGEVACLCARWINFWQRANASQREPMGKEDR